MGRTLRFLPAAGCLVEVTHRTFQGRPLLRPSAEVNEILVGVLGRAQRRTGMVVCATTWMSNHWHALLVPRDARQLAEFMGYVEGNVAREIGRRTGWRAKLWHGRYHHALVSDEPEAQVRRLEYVLANGIKEGLVARARDWPGVHCAEALIEGTPLTGTWFDRSRQYEARRGGKPCDPRDFATTEQVVLSPLPCWQHLNPVTYRQRVRELLEGVEQQAAAERRATGASVAGARAVRTQKPTRRPRKLKTSPQPRIHAVSRKARKALAEAYALFAAAYRAAAERLRNGDLTAVFPDGCFPPPLPFVEARAGLPP